jgi:hypothetical protein
VSGPPAPERRGRRGSEATRKRREPTALRRS